MLAEISTSWLPAETSFRKVAAGPTFFPSIARSALSGEPCSAYRPDLHYMRGPGPKWHAKYGGLVTQTSPSIAPSLDETADNDL